MNYPIELRRREVAAIVQRRRVEKYGITGKPPVGEAGAVTPPGEALDDELPTETVALAISGGGIRCAAFALGVLQALAKKNRLRAVDILSSVSGGGYTAAFLGRLFTRKNVRDHRLGPCARVQDILSNNGSTEMMWLRTHANYLVSQGSSDFTDHLAVFWRNLLTIYFVLSLLVLGTFGLLRIAADWVHQCLPVPSLATWVGQDIADAFSLWWWLPLAILGLAMVPLKMAYWLAPKPGSSASFSFFPLAAWVVLFVGLALGLPLEAGLMYGAIAITVIVLSIVWLEATRKKLPQPLDRSTEETTPDAGSVIRNRLTRALGETITLLLLAIVWVALDTLARGLANGHFKYLVAGWSALVAPALPFMSGWAQKLGAGGPGGGDAQPSGFKASTAYRAGIIAFPVAGLLIVLLDWAVHALFNHDGDWGTAVTWVALALSVVLGRAFDFLNYSALQQSYAVRLGRTFLGASNPARSRTAGKGDGCNVQITHPDDDINYVDYHPETGGGPLHLMGLCVNETIDAASQREIRDLKGLPMCVSPCGMSVGLRFHGVWSKPPMKVPLRVRFRRLLDGRLTADPMKETALQGLPTEANGFTVFKGKTDAPILVEPLRLGTWTAVSGAAFGTGTGRTTSLPVALLLGLVNLRLGYWWDSGLNPSERPGQYPGNLWVRLKNLPAFLIRMQSLLLSDFLARFGGPSQRFWNISDGGHFDVTGIYELVRRRAPFILAIDGGMDPKLDLIDLADLVRQVRIDFGAEVDFIGDVSAAGLAALNIPLWIQNWVNVSALGSLDDLGVMPGNAGKHSLLARITYGEGGNEPKQVSWMVVMKSSLTGDESLDIAGYKKMSADFPGESTADQFFDEAQWESYRMLGEHIGTGTVR